MKFVEITNEEIRVFMNVNTYLKEKIQKGHLIWYGHVEPTVEDDTRILKQIFQHRKKEEHKTAWIHAFEK